MLIDVRRRVYMQWFECMQDQRTLLTPHSHYRGLINK